MAGFWRRKEGSALPGVAPPVPGLVATRAYECAETPARLATLASGEIGPDEWRQLEEHLAGCQRCQRARLELERAERAFWAAITGTVIKPQ